MLTQSSSIPIYPLRRTVKRYATCDWSSHVVDCGRKRSVSRLTSSIHSMVRSDGRWVDLRPRPRINKISPKPFSGCGETAALWCRPSGDDWCVRFLPMSFVAKCDALLDESFSLARRRAIPTKLSLRLSLLFQLVGCQTVSASLTSLLTSIMRGVYIVSGLAATRPLPKSQVDQSSTPR